MAALASLPLLLTLLDRPPPPLLLPSAPRRPLLPLSSLSLLSDVFFTATLILSSCLVRRDTRPRFPPLPLLVAPPGKVTKLKEPFYKRIETKTDFHQLRLLCPVSLAALRARALWLLCPCLNTAPTAFAFVPAIRFSTSGGLFEGNSKGQKYLKIPNLSKLYDTMVACYNYYLIESKLHVDLSTCIR